MIRGLAVMLVVVGFLIVADEATTQQAGFQINVVKQFQPGGLSLSSKIGDSNEFASTREYRQGEQQARQRRPRCRAGHHQSAGTSPVRVAIRAAASKRAVFTGLLINVLFSTGWVSLTTFDVSPVTMKAGIFAS